MVHVRVVLHSDISLSQEALQNMSLAISMIVSKISGPLISDVHNERIIYDEIKTCSNNTCYYIPEYGLARCVVVKQYKWIL